MFNNRGYLDKNSYRKKANIAQLVLKIILLTEILSVYTCCFGESMMRSSVQKESNLYQNYLV